MMTEQMITEKIQNGLPGAQIKARDLTGGGDHWQVDIKASQFQGLSLMEQHQLVYKILGEWLKKEIHALTLNTRT